jgi:cysteine desulfurase/selenocysteine lyase
MEAGDKTWEAIREDFPSCQPSTAPLIYFDNAATSQKPRAVINTLSHFYEHDNSNVHRGLHELSNRATAAYENSRKLLADYPRRGAGDDHFTRGTPRVSTSPAGEANVGKDDVILLTEMEHHSNLVPWRSPRKERRSVSFPSPPTACSIWTISTPCSTDL